MAQKVAGIFFVPYSTKRTIAIELPFFLMWPATFTNTQPTMAESNNFLHSACLGVVAWLAKSLNQHNHI